MTVDEFYSCEAFRYACRREYRRMRARNKVDVNEQRAVNERRG
jgi:hypothetical protein